MLYLPAALLCGLLGARILAYIWAALTYALVGVSISKLMERGRAGRTEDGSAPEKKHAGGVDDPSEKLRHDIRGELQVVGGFADVLAMEKCGELNEAQRRHLNCLRKGVKELTALVESGERTPVQTTKRRRGWLWSGNNARSASGAES